MEEVKEKRKKIDGILFFIVITLVAIGLVMILSSSFYRGVERFNDGYYFFKRQLAWAAIGIFAMFFMIVLKLNFLKKLIRVGYIGSIGFLIVVFVIATVIKGAKRWIGLGVLNFQPSEFAKIAMILMLALSLAKKRELEDKTRITYKDFYPEYFIIFLPAFLIIVENISTFFIILATGFAMLFTAGLKVEKFAIFFAIPLLILLIFAIKSGAVDQIKGIFGGKYENRLNRLNVWIDPWKDPKGDGFQVIQSLYAVGSGGMFGVGLGKSKQKLGYIPEAQNDMIFPIICEEFGLLGAITLLTLFMILILRGVWIAIHVQDKFAAFYAIGMVSIIAVQVIINVAVVTGVVPTTGMPLPFISYGGSSLLFLLIGIGILLNISRYVKN